jgi:diamine N-acetyltransferase
MLREVFLEEEMLRGKKILIDKLSLPDAYQMMNWKKADDILKREFHFLTIKDGNVKEWFDARDKRKNIISFVVKTHEGKVIGFISIRDINKIFKSAILGITFDMNYIGMGYGTESLSLFLNYYFNVLNMRKIILDVAQHNKRAIRCYEKVGFNITNKFYMKLEEDYYDFIIEELKANKTPEFMEKFRIIGPFVFIGYYRMKLSKKDFINFHMKKEE